VKLVDTSVLVDHLRGHRAATGLLEDLDEAGERVVTSELTRFELLVGARAAEHALLEQLFSALAWVPVTEDVARVAGEYARSFRRSHTGIGAIDYLLAATASVLGADLLTTNVRHFPMFDDLASPY
jgi:predicted nucleic acid-binding protein